MKEFISLIILLLFLCISVQSHTSYAFDGEALFKTKCAGCHANGSGVAQSFAPVKYASSQWERFFERNKHERKKDISKEILPEEIKLIKNYLINHAADSDRPIAAGLK
ncbi:MAG: cytochrome c [Desulfobacterales bacterium]|nr:cytochrome c [Desulfobacterales bacterium]